ncbi:MAG: universal stress protein UspA [Rhizobiales bacterium 65-9]|nr:universal stress protein [Hyphomicrobiales bacterium]OJY34988.1 MAG: universal stress protein UspA [Rhizobiales bacterium 65-9]
MSKRRRSYESGHRPKYLAIVDGTPESAVALRYAGRRASRVTAGVALLSVVPMPEAPPILGVGSLMEAEATEEAQTLLDQAAERMRALAGVEPQTMVRVGAKADEILKLIDEDEDIAFIVLAAGTGKDGPGPLVSSLAGKAAATFPIPIVIVPGHLQPEEIDAMA